MPKAVHSFTQFLTGHKPDEVRGKEMDSEDRTYLNTNASRHYPATNDGSEVTDDLSREVEGQYSAYCRRFLA